MQILQTHKNLDISRTTHTKWLNKLWQLCRLLPTNCLSVFDHFVGLAPKKLQMKSNEPVWCINAIFMHNSSENRKNEIWLRVLSWFTKLRLIDYILYFTNSNLCFICNTFIFTKRIPCQPCNLNSTKTDPNNGL